MTHERDVDILEISSFDNVYFATTSFFGLRSIELKEGHTGVPNNFTVPFRLESSLSHSLTAKAAPREQIAIKL